MLSIFAAEYREDDGKKKPGLTGLCFIEVN
jgi:hypothetical protein